MNKDATSISNLWKKTLIKKANNVEGRGGESESEIENSEYYG